MIGALIITLLASFFGLVVGKNLWFAPKLTDMEKVLIRMGLAGLAFASVEGREILSGGSSFLEALFTMIAVYGGVISSFVASERASSGKKPVFTDTLSVVGGYIADKYGEKLCQWLYVFEVVFYLLTISL